MKEAGEANISATLRAVDRKALEQAVADFLKATGVPPEEHHSETPALFLRFRQCKLRSTNFVEQSRALMHLVDVVAHPLHPLLLRMHYQVRPLRYYL